MSLPHQLIGWPETQEQLRKLVALFSEVKRVQCREEGQRPQIGVLFYRFIMDLLNFSEKSGECEQNKITLRHNCEVVWHLLH